MFHFLSGYLVGGCRYDLFSVFDKMRRDTCRSDFVRYQAKTWKQPCVAFRDQGDDPVRQISSMNGSYGYTIVNCVRSLYSSISQVAGIFRNKLTADAGWRRICICVRPITIYSGVYIMQIISMLTCRSEVLCRVCILQIQPTKHSLGHAVCVAPIPQREIDHKNQGYICPVRASSCSGNRRWTDNDLYITWIISMLTDRSEVLWRAGKLQIQPSKHALDRAMCLAPVPKRELGHVDQGYICSVRGSSCSGNWYLFVRRV